MKENEYPIRPGEEDCLFYLKTGRCGFRDICRFNHPKDIAEKINLPKCKYFLKGSCIRGSTCVFEHSKEGEGTAPMRQRQKRQRTESSYGASPERRERQADDLEEQKQKKKKVEFLRIDPSVQCREGGIQTEQRFEIPENLNVMAQVNQQEQADRERQNREAQEKAEEERRQQIDTERRLARLRLEQMRPSVLTDNVNQIREVLPDIGIDRKEGDGF